MTIVKIPKNRISKYSIDSKTFSKKRTSPVGRCSTFDLLSLEIKIFRGFQLLYVKDKIFTVIIDIIINCCQPDGPFGAGFSQEQAENASELIDDKLFWIPCFAFLFIGNDGDGQRRADPGAQATGNAF